MRLYGVKWLDYGAELRVVSELQKFGYADFDCRGWSGGAIYRAELLHFYVWRERKCLRSQSWEAELRSRVKKQSLKWHSCITTSIAFFCC